MGQLQGRVALISGGARGQGAEEARLFAREGASVVIGDLAEAEGRALAEETGGVFVRLDVAQEADWEAAIRQTEAAHGRLDVLVNNAGIIRPVPIEACSLESFNEVVAVNQTGVFLGMKTAVRLMKRTGGSIVNISSVAGLRGAAKHVAYAGSKFAVRGMTKVAAIEFAEYGIRVNSVHPGLISTAMIDVLMDEAAVQARTATQLVPRAGTSAEVAELVLFLASDRSSFCTGAEFVCDGGVMTGSR